VKGGVYYSGLKGFKVGVFNSYFSKPADVINTQTELPANRQRREYNPMPTSFQIMTLNLNVNVNQILDVKQGPDIVFNFFIDNLLDEDIYYPEFSRRTINSLPAYPGRAYYATLAFKF